MTITPPAERTNAWERLAVAAADRDASAPRIIRWVFERLGVPVSDIPLTEPPSAGAVQLLRYLRCEDAGEMGEGTDRAKRLEKFYTSTWPKVMGKEEEVESDRAGDTGGECSEMVRVALAAAERARGGGAAGGAAAGGAAPQGDGA